MSELSNIFVGVPQSRYAALAILIAIVVVALTIIFGDSPVPMSQKFGFVLMVFLISLPGLALSLFQLTCIVTGAGVNSKNWWCNAYAWVLSAIMIFYAVLLVIAAVMSLSSKNTEGFKSGSTDGHTSRNKLNKFAVDEPTSDSELNIPINIPEESDELPPLPPDMPNMMPQPVMPSAMPPSMPSAMPPSMPNTNNGMENFTSSYAAW